MDNFKAWIDKWGSNKIFLGLLAVLLLMGSITIFAIEVPKRSFQLEDQTFKYVKLDQGVYYFEDAAGNTLTAYRQGQDPRITSYYDSAWITYNGKTFLQEVDFKEADSYQLYLENDLIFKSDLMGIQYTDNAFELAPIESDIYTEETIYFRTLVHHVMSRVEYLNQSAIFNKSLMLIFTSILGLLCLIFPKKLWALQHFKSTTAGDPTLFFLVTTRIMGFIFFLLGINGILL